MNALSFNSKMPKFILLALAYMTVMVLSTQVNGEIERCGRTCGRRGRCWRVHCGDGYFCQQEATCSYRNRKCSSTEAVCIKAGPAIAEHDPHLRGFDGSTFGFHGLHDRHYVLFGRKGGDLVVGKVMATDKKNSFNVAATYFSEIGITLAGNGDKVKLGFESLNGKVSSEHFIVRLNDKPISEGLNITDNAVSIDNMKKVVTVSTNDAIYEISAIKTGHLSHHFNIKTNLRHKAHSKENYLGILGSTLNRKTGRHDIEFGKTLRFQDLEKHLREMYGVESLFPEHLNDPEYSDDMATYENLHLTEDDVRTFADTLE